ncbi:hypothetical protein F4782DRAFT_528183 [Xylaria castorea]|nr:hypothetical protein F4782DRAFT_528183 [Xylaria castorea]
MKRNERQAALYKDQTVTISFKQHILLDNLTRATVNKDNTQQVYEDIADSLASYYKLARKRFVDSVCQQVVNHFLLGDKESPLKILSPELITSLDAAQLKTIAWEDAVSKHQRHALETKTQAFGTALKMLRGN